MKLHYIPHKEGEYHGLSKPHAQNGDSVEKMDGHRYPSGLVGAQNVLKKRTRRIMKCQS